MATITQIAERAGVSAKTVSRVINGHEHISQKTRKKVEQAIEALGFSPSAFAGTAKRGDTLSIGMLYGDPSSGYQSKLNHAVLKACSDARRYLAVELFDEKGAQWRSQVEDFLDRTGVKNLILVPPMCDSSELHLLLQERGIRFVLISPSRPVLGAFSITMDDRLAAMEITKHLIELGHKRIGHIAGHEGHVATLMRQLGFEEALANAGLLEAYPPIVLPGRFRFREAVRCAETMLSANPRPTAIFAANDEMAAAVVMTANRLGLGVPKELSVAGFDGTAIAERMWPDLTTIEQPYDAIAREAVKWLIAGGEPEEKGVVSTRVLPHRLAIRGSTGPAPE